LGIGDWGLGPIPNPQSPIPNPQSPQKIANKLNLNFKLYYIMSLNYKLYIILKNIGIFFLKYIMNL
jgi:hypothetical protein